jgi:hypothetical protein
MEEWKMQELLNLAMFASLMLFLNVPARVPGAFGCGRAATGSVAAATPMTAGSAAMPGLRASLRAGSAPQPGHVVGKLLDAGDLMDVTGYCSAPGVLDDNCFRNALAKLKDGQNSILQVPRGVFRITALDVTTPNVTFKCLSGAVLKPVHSSAGIRVNANNIAFDSCELDMQEADSAPGILATKVSDFSFKNGSIINIQNQPGLQLNQTSNATIDHNHFVTNGNADGLVAYGPTSQIHITNNSGIASIDVISGRNANGSSSGVFFTGNVLQPIANKTILTTGDFTDGYGPASPITNIVITGNTCTIVAANPAVAPFGCFSLVGSYDLTFSRNVMNAKGQYVGDSLLELGTSRATISMNTLTAGDDPGAQSYDGIVIYSGGVSLSGNIFEGSSAYGDSIRIYPQTNARNISIGGGSINFGSFFGAQIISQVPGTKYSGIGDCSVEGGVYASKARCTVTVDKDGGAVFTMTYAGQYTVPPTAITTNLKTQGTPATIQIGRARNHAIAVACNQDHIPVRVTGISGAGPTGPVTSVSVFEYPGENAPVGGGFITTPGTPISGGSGSGLKLDILSVDQSGGIASIGVSAGGSGSGYKIGDIVQYPVTDQQFAAEASGVSIGGGLTISGAIFHAVDIQGFQGTRCPVSASIENLGISGSDDTNEVVTGIYQRNASVKLGKLSFTHVATSADGNH